LYEKTFGNEKLINKNNDLRIMFEYPSPNLIGKYEKRFYIFLKTLIEKTKDMT
jgi:hypothetical protein